MDFITKIMAKIKIEKKEEVKKDVTVHEKQLARQNPKVDPDMPVNKQRWFR